MSIFRRTWVPQAGIGQLSRVSCLYFLELSRGRVSFAQDLYNSVPTLQKRSHETFPELHKTGNTTQRFMKISLWDGFKEGKASQVRFQDEVLSCDINNLTEYHRFALPAKGEEPIRDQSFML